jgi:hypothetical protein
VRGGQKFEIDTHVAIERRNAEGALRKSLCYKIWRRRFAWRNEMTMDALSLFGLFAVTAMLVAYALEAATGTSSPSPALARSARSTVSCRGPVGLVEAIRAGVAFAALACQAAMT